MVNKSKEQTSETSREAGNETGESRLPGLPPEDVFIETLARKYSTPHPQLIKGIGDDTSVTAQTPGTVLLTTTDTLVESTHFTLTNTTPVQLGAKALSVSISDIAAMGATPTFFFVSLILPKTVNAAFVDAIYKGLSATAIASGATLAGGNTATGDRLSITTTLLGEALPEEVVYRSGANVGDDLYVTGTPGDSALGLHILRDSSKEKASEEAGRAKKEQFRLAIKRHNTPTPRLGVGRMLATGKIATSMIDVSDGVVLDAVRLSKESRVGLTIEADRLPLSKEMKKFMDGDPEAEKAGLTMALAGGEDYELLFTAKQEDRERIAAIASKMQLRITVIGSVTTTASASDDASVEGAKSSPGVRVLDGSGAEVPLERGGYTHF